MPLRFLKIIIPVAANVRLNRKLSLFSVSPNVSKTHHVYQPPVIFLHHVNCSNHNKWTEVKSPSRTGHFSLNLRNAVKSLQLSRAAQSELLSVICHPFDKRISYFKIIYSLDKVSTISWTISFVIKRGTLLVYGLQLYQSDLLNQYDKMARPAEVTHFFCLTKLESGSDTANQCIKEEYSIPTPRSSSDDMQSEQAVYYYDVTSV